VASERANGRVNLCDGGLGQHPHWGQEH